MTGNLTEDPKAWSEAGHITTKGQRESIKARFVDPDDPLQIVIVRDMWLTGFDAPCVNTLYVDKPMKGHNLMQAIARVNRIFKDKPGGLIVDYIGIADELKEATRKYTSGGGRGSLTEDLTRKALATFLHQLEVARACLPPKQTYNRWRDLDLIELEDLTNLCYGTLADEQLREDFLAEEHRLSKGYSLVMHVPTARAHAEEVAFCQMIRKQLQKLDPKVKQGLETLDRAVRDLLDESISAQPAVDIFAVAGLDKPDISILDEKFLAGFKQQRQQDLQARLLERLMPRRSRGRETAQPGPLPVVSADAGRGHHPLQQPHHPSSGRGGRHGRDPAAATRGRAAQTGAWIERRGIGLLRRRRA